MATAWLEKQGNQNGSSISRLSVCCPRQNEHRHQKVANNYVSYFKEMSKMPRKNHILRISSFSSFAQSVSQEGTTEPNKKLCYCRKTARRAMLVNSCYVSRGTRDRKVSKSKSDFQGHSRVLAIVPVDRPHTIKIKVFHCNYVSILHR